MCHQYHILMEFQNPFFNQPLDQNLQVFLQWFKPLTYWSGLFSTNSNHTLFHFHRPCHLINNQIQSLPSAVIYKELTHTILDQKSKKTDAFLLKFRQDLMAHGISKIAIHIGQKSKKLKSNGQT